MIRLVLTAALLICGVAGFAQQITFSKIFSNYPLRAENGLNIFPYANGYYLIGYNSCSGDATQDCMTITKLSEDGNILWLKEYEHYGSLQTQAVFVGNRIYLSGRTAQTEYQFLLYCLDLEGNLIWKKTYGNPAQREWSPGLVLLSDSTLLLFGTRDRHVTQENEWLPILLRVSLNGDSLSTFSFNQQYEASSSLSTIEDGENNLVSAYVYCPDACFAELKAGVTSLDADGNINWALDFPYSFFPSNCLISHFSDQMLAIKWYVDSNIPNYDLTPPALFFTDEAGSILDTLVFENQTLKEILNIQPGQSASLAGCGFEYIDYLHQSNPVQAGWLFNIGKNRQITWEKTYVDTTFDGSSYGLYYITPTPDGGYIATGTINNRQTGVLESNNWILKLDSAGCLQPGCSALNYVTDTRESVFMKGLDIKIAPNPASETIRIELPDDFNIKECQAELFSLSGALMLQQRVETSPTFIPVKRISAGSYVLVLKRSNEILYAARVIISP